MDSSSLILHPKRQRDRRLTAGFVATMAAMALLALLDMQWDVREGLSFQHVAIEKCLLLVGLVGVAAFIVRLTNARKIEHQSHSAALGLRIREAQLSTQAEFLAKRLVAAEGEADRWKREARRLLEGLGVVVDDQFGRWKLTPAERDVALLLLKGLSHKEVAEIRKTTEATVRQQAQAIYRKSGLTNRSDLAAYFLEDLL
jgi:DNA-binding CsgD family transcriptional regulator